MPKYDRHSQYDPCTPLQNAARDAKIADDEAATAMSDQQNIIDDLTRKATLLGAKVQPFGGATPEDYQTYGLTLGTLRTEVGKIAALQTAQSKTKVASDLARQAWREAVNATDQNPGAIEQV